MIRMEPEPYGMAFAVEPKPVTFSDPEIAEEVALAAQNMIPQLLSDRPA